MELENRSQNGILGERGARGTKLGGARYQSRNMEAVMPLILWLLGVPLVVVIALMLLHVI
jgi:hypothetical protein